MHWTKIEDGIWEGNKIKDGIWEGKKKHCDTKFKIKGIVFVGKLLQNGETILFKTYEIEEIEEISCK